MFLFLATDINSDNFTWNHWILYNMVIIESMQREGVTKNEMIDNQAVHIDTHLEIVTDIEI